MSFDESFNTVPDGDIISLFDLCSIFSLEESFSCSSFISYHTINHNNFFSIPGSDFLLFSFYNLHNHVVAASGLHEILNFDEYRCA